MVTVTGRPRRPDSDICPKCRIPGYFNKVTSWSSPNKNDSRRTYYQFIHSNRGLPPCYIGKRKLESSGPLQVVREYRRQTKKVVTYEFDKGGLIHKTKESQVVPVIIYSFPEEFKLQLKRLKQLTRQLTLRKKEKEWIFHQFQGDLNYYYITKLSENHVLTFGKEAEKIFQKVKSDKTRRCKIRRFDDNPGLLHEILEKRKAREKRSESA